MIMSLDARTDLLLSDPAGLANQSLYEWEHMSRAEVDALQLAGLQRRFSELRDQIPVLKKLADGDDIEHIDDVEDVLPLLFEHTVYKSYPPALLEGNRFTQINRWLGRLVLPEVAEALAAADVAGCQGLDDYFAAIDRQVPALRLGHSSGTSGTISFLPHSHVEADKHAQVRRPARLEHDGPRHATTRAVRGVSLFPLRVRVPVALERFDREAPVARRRVFSRRVSGRPRAPT